MGSQQGRAGQSQSGAEWDIDDADEIPGGQAFHTDEPLEAVAVDHDGEVKPVDQLQSSASEEWNLDDGWETNIPIAVAAPPVAAIPVVNEGVGLPKEGWHPEDIEAAANEPASEGGEMDAEVAAEINASLLDDSDHEAVVEETAEVAASEEAQPSAGEPIEETTDDVLALIVEAERKCERTGATVIGLTARLKEAKENDKAAQNELRELIREVGMDFTRPMVAKPAAANVTKSAPASKSASKEASDSDSDDDEDEIDTDLEDSGSEDEAVVATAETVYGNPTRIRITQEDEQFPQLLLDSEHAVTAFEEEGEPGEGIVTIDDPANSEKELFLSPAEYEVVAWEELPVEEVASIPISTGPNSAAASQAKANEKNSRPEDDSWRKASLLDDVGLPPNLAALLEANPEKTLKTMGDVQDWTAKGNNLSDIPKIGPAKVTQLEDAFEKFWAKWNAKR